MAVLSSVLAAFAAQASGPTDPQPYRAALLAAAGFALIGAASALRVPDKEAAETMRPRDSAHGGAGLQAVEAA